ncbi:hypothetical protein [Salinibacterium sp. TMP30]|uniref:hypothetical protein n=1 Tax=Salinibacterium sp. TMP30 TaxID=3138237 RepID=UPI003139F563
MSEVDELRLPGFIAESEVLPPSKNLGLRLLALLIGLGLLVGVSVAGGAALLTMIWPDRAGMCDASAGPCNDLTVEQIAQFSAIDLPASATIDDAQYAQVESSGLLFATVVLADGDTDPLRSVDYRVSPSLPWASEVDALMLDNLVLYEGVESVTGPGFEAASGQRADGRTVILIRVSRAI